MQLVMGPCPSRVIPKTIAKMVQTASLHGTQEIDSAALLSKRPGGVRCGSVYGDIDLKDLWGSTIIVGYHIPDPDFYLVLHAEKAL